jgi:hypothetical protein
MLIDINAKVPEDGGQTTVKLDDKYFLFQKLKQEMSYI